MLQFLAGRVHCAPIRNTLNGGRVVKVRKGEEGGGGGEFGPFIGGKKTMRILLI